MAALDGLHKNRGRPETGATHISGALEQAGLQLDVSDQAMDLPAGPIRTHLLCKAWALCLPILLMRCSTAANRSATGESS